MKNALVGLLLLAAAFPVRAQSDAAFANKLIEFRRDLRAHPETGNRETRTMGKIADYLKALGISDVKTGVAVTGVVAVIHGGKPGPTVALRTPIDALAFDKGPLHACGHDAMTAAVLGAAELLQTERKSLAGNVKLLFQPAEEGAPAGEKAGAPLMVEEGALDGVSSVIAFHVDDRIPAGQAGLHSGSVYAGLDDFEAKVVGKSAHAARPSEGVDSIAAAAFVIAELQTLASREMNLHDAFVISVTKIQGGSAMNRLAGETTFAGTLRSLSPAARQKARAGLERVVTKVAEAHDAKAELKFVDSTPPVANDPKLVSKLKPVLEEALGRQNLEELHEPFPYSDDFSYISEKVPSLYFQLGTRNEKKGITAPTHNEAFDVDESIIPLGAKLLAELAQAALSR